MGSPVLSDAPEMRARFPVNVLDIRRLPADARTSAVAAQGGVIHMSMMGRLQAVSDSQIDRMIRDPFQVHEALGLTSHATCAQLVAHVAGSRPRLRVTWGDEEVAEPYAGESLDLEKTWHGLHFLLTGQARGGQPPKSFLFNGGVSVGQAPGFGPARALRSAQVARFHRAIAGLSEAELRRRYDPERMMREGVYPGVWQREPAGQCTDWLCESFHRLQSFVARVSGGGSGMLVCLL